MKYWDRTEWLKTGTQAQRRKTATLNPLAWILEYQPKILLPGKGLVAFEPWPFQQDFLRDKHQFRAINKPRQCGISTTEAADVAWEFDNIPGSQIVIISKDKDAAENFHRYVYNILVSVRETNPDAPKLTKTNQRVTENSIGSKITSLASSKEAGRSFSATHLILDELAFIEYADDIWQAANATLAQTNGRVTAISTPKGRANLFYRIFESPKSKYDEEINEMGFKTFQYAWYDVPTYNPFYDEYIAAKDAGDKKMVEYWKNEARNVRGGWYQRNRPKYSDLAWRQEFEGDFDANVGTVFSTRSIEKVFVRNYLEEKEDPRGVLRDWYTSPVDPNKYYFTGIDLGRKNDPTVIITYEYNHETKFGKMVDYKYIEPGRSDWEMIQGVIIDHLETWEPESRHDDTGVGGGVSGAFSSASDGFNFTKNSKQNIIETMQHAFDFGTVMIPKIPTLYREHQRYIWDDKDITQDTVMANALAISQFHDTEGGIFIGVDPSIHFIESPVAA